MAAIIYQEAVRGSEMPVFSDLLYYVIESYWFLAAGFLILPRDHHSIISLDGYEFWLNIVTSEEPYRNYIRNHENFALHPDSLAPALNGLARYQAYGSYLLSERVHMENLMILLWALVLCQVRNNKKLDNSILEPLKTQVNM